MQVSYQEVFNKLDEGVYYVDPNRKITFRNKSAERITGYKAEDVIESYCYDNILRHVDDFGNELCLSGCPLHKTITDSKVRETKVYLFHKKGHRVKVYVKTIPLKNDRDEVIGAVEIFSKEKGFSEKMLNSDIKRLESLAYTDSLTKLYNREYMHEYLNLKIQEFRKFGHILSLLFVDIDHFKAINDTYGHLIGDEILKLVANTMKNSIRHDDLVVRWGGEEFVILCTGLNEDYLEEFANTIRVLVQSSVYTLEDEKISVTVSIGAAMIKGSDTKESIIQRADDLMYQSKRLGRNRVSL